MTLFTLFADLELDTGLFNTEIANATQTGKTLAESIGADAESIRTAFTNAFAFSVADILADSAKEALGYLADFTGESITMAANVEQTNEKLKALFGPEGAAEIRNWAQTTKTQFGISEQAAKKYVSDIAGLWGNENIGFTQRELIDMATNLVELTGDLASFNNFTVEETWTKILSGMRGETEAIEDLGIDLRAASIAPFFGIKESDWGKLDQKTRILNTYEYALAMTTHAQGDFARTGESYQNQLALFNANIEELKASLGDELLPVMTQMVTWFNSFFGGSEDASEVIGNLGDDFVDTYAQIDTTTEKALKLIDALTKMEETGVSTADEQSQWNAILQELSSTLGGEEGIGAIIDETTGKITGGTEALKDYALQWQETQRQLAISAVLQDALSEITAQSEEVARLQYKVNVASLTDADAQAQMMGIQEAVREYLNLPEDTPGYEIADYWARANESGDYYTKYMTTRYEEIENRGEGYDALVSQLKAAEARLDDLNNEYIRLQEHVNTLSAETTESDDSEKYAADIAQAVSQIASAAPVVNVLVSVDGQELAALVTSEVERQMSRNVSTKSR